MDVMRWRARHELPPKPAAHAATKRQSTTEDIETALQFEFSERDGTEVRESRAGNVVPSVVWICLILAVAFYGSVVVRHVTEALTDIAYPTSRVVLDVHPER